jgi:hypothetical protein
MSPEWTREELLEEIKRLREAIAYMGRVAGRLKCEAVKALALDALDDWEEHR